MRKDVKLGFAIGGVLLAVLIVYVLVVPGSDKPASPQSKGPEPEKVVGEAPLLANANGANAQSGPTTTPVAVNPPNGTGPDVFAKPAGTGDVAQAKAEPKWDKLLDGEVPLSAAVGGVSPIGKGGAVAPNEIATTHTPTIGATGATPPSTQALAPDHPTAPAGSHTHMIREGETLSSISAAAYGNPNLYSQILKANPGLDPAKLKIGATINLPEATEAKHEGIANAAVSGEKVTINSTTEYKVAPGDSLYKISVKLYGKSDFSTKIYDLNKAAIGADPAKLKVGSVLKLPQAPTVAASH